MTTTAARRAATAACRCARVVHDAWPAAGARTGGRARLHRLQGLQGRQAIGRAGPLLTRLPPAHTPAAAGGRAAGGGRGGRCRGRSRRRGGRGGRAPAAAAGALPADGQRAADGGGRPAARELGPQQEARAQLALGRRRRGRRRRRAGGPARLLPPPPPAAPAFLHLHSPPRARHPPTPPFSRRRPAVARAHPAGRLPVGDGRAAAGDQDHQLGVLDASGHHLQAVQRRGGLAAGAGRAAGGQQPAGVGQRAPARVQVRAGAAAAAAAALARPPCTPPRWPPRAQPPRRRPRAGTSPAPTSTAGTTA
jgi:hypothetical protein